MSAVIIPTLSSVVGSTVSSAVYTSIVTTGEFSATTVSKGIGWLGKGIGYGAEVTISRALGNTIRMVGDLGETLTAPAISSGSKAIAAGASLVAGAVAGLLTAGVCHASIGMASYVGRMYTYYTSKPVTAEAVTETTVESKSDQQTGA